MQRRIGVNGVEYARLEDVPAEVRRLLQHELPDSFKTAPASRAPAAARTAGPLSPPELAEAHRDLPSWVRVESVAAWEARRRRAWRLAVALVLFAVAAVIVAWLLAR